MAQQQMMQQIIRDKQMQQKLSAMKILDETKDAHLSEDELFAQSIRHKPRSEFTAEERQKCIEIALRFASPHHVEAVQRKVEDTQPQGSWIKSKLLADQMQGRQRASTPLRVRDGNVMKPSRLKNCSQARQPFDLSSSPISCA
jgi:hypothetical protein